MGEQQSPINIVHRLTVPTGDIGLDVRWLPGVRGFEVRPEADGVRFHPHDQHVVRLGEAVFRLENVHFHRPSEHWVEGVRQTAEMHAVHIRADESLRVCVVAVFLELAYADSAPTASVPGPSVPGAGSVGTVPGSVLPGSVLPGSVVRGPEEFALRDLLPAESRCYRYEGSLTTPEFDETVSWVVLREPVKVTDPNLAAFIRSHADKARAPQRLNRRFVLSST
ncbi:carbonic anhydrase family protein [Actinosynnema sp. NPDC047251]|uniref:carbonic anhydrase n=1 Tax=Saccharothrix espanaensis (strain ATCC 51144 / DSM 44229 / JCM 9112 / NBRC 15066 / NRRL 15764) TaxID=1179773 RepID=K0JRU9_SACES|nr:carbonic anhydrase family protein [Saccharothrix espanaensis]CCH30405.1 hypothetical protein BN6_31000 [Saccharothrix espanaensis DSM 44229]